ncbi:PQQ-binding-like beta-propeller repeat protein [Cohnella sp. REN36]|uniref:outer membrane protein assembly factor BamB family protein n=1 Tax=Cohnella sp. REN36 TaxID=2887347 RepID=UPI001D133474|nr:PQQ-binding-like beta-propeller repeat protein [Cohnella sp. REN36]MCC3377622.1 PQQ-binding-like beta-propeller repeat protein [Cohnella sp. REN36]
MKSFKSRASRLAARGAILLLLAGCDSSDPVLSGLPSPSSSATADPVQTAGPAEAFVPPRLDWTPEQFDVSFRAGWTPDEARSAMGQPDEMQEAAWYRASKLVTVDRWTYETESGRLELLWSKEGRPQLRDAIFYGRTPEGERSSYVPAMGAQKEASSSEENAPARQAKLRIGQRVSATVATVGYDMRAGAKPIYNYMALPGRPVTLVALTREMAEVDDDGFRSWIPVWYLTGESGQVHEIAPRLLQVGEEGATAVWYPGAVDAVASLSAGDRVYAVQVYADWLGVAVPDRVSDGGYGLLWVRADRLREVHGVSASFEPSLPAAADEAAAYVRSALGIGAKRERTEALLGPPTAVERSGNVAMPGQLQTLETWRYENEEALLELTWAEDGTLRNERFRDWTGYKDFGNDEWAALPEGQVPKAERLQAEASAPHPFADTRQTEARWRTALPLPYNYLIGLAGSTLLVAGEDGGFSGMHEDSRLYGLDRETGRMLWQHSFGYAEHLYALSGDGRTIAFAKRIAEEPEGTGATYRLYALNPSNGDVRWSRDLKFQGAVGDVRLTAAGSKLGLSYTVFEGEGESRKVTTYLEARQLDTGNRLWGQELDGEGGLVLQDGRMPYFVVGLGATGAAQGTLTAFRAEDGRRMWRLNERAPIDTFDDGAIQFDPRNLTAGPGGYWTRQQDDLILADKATGRPKVSLASPAQSRLTILNDRYALLAVPQDGKTWYASEEGSTALLDLPSGRSLWSMPGLAADGLIDGGDLYVRMDGKLVKVDLRTGDVRWASEYGISGKMVPHSGILVVESMPDVIAVDKTNGKVLYRFGGIRIGSYDFPPQRQAYGLLTVLDGSLYAGSSNGTFARLD